MICIAGCAIEQIRQRNNTSIAVWDLEDLSPMGSPHSDLGELLSAKIIETLDDMGNHTVVERERLLLALQELNLGTTPLVDTATQLKIGKMVGAQLMVFGTYLVIENKMRLDLRLVEVETGRILKAAEKTLSTADLSKWLQATKQTTAELF